MKNKDSKKQNLEKLKKSTFFDEEKLPKVKKSIDEILEELDKELAENKKTVAEIGRIMQETMSYEQLIQLSNLVRLNPGFQS